MTKINIAELDIDVHTLLERQSEVLQTISQLTKEQKELSRITKEYGTASTETAAKLSQLSARLSSLTKEYETNKAALLSHHEAVQKEMSAINALTSSTLNLDKALTKENASMAQAKSRVSELTKERNKLNIATEEGRKAMEAINSKIDQSNANIKVNVSSLEQQKTGVIGYAKSIIEAAQSLDLEGKSLNLVNSLIGKLQGGLQNYSKAQLAVNSATSSQVKILKLLKVALASTGIGLIIVALTSLVSYFKKTEEGARDLRVVLTYISTAFNKLGDLLAPLGKAIVQIFKDPMQSVKNLGQAIEQNIINRGKGFVDIFKNTGKSVKEFFTGNFKEASQAIRDSQAAVGQFLTGITKEDIQAVGATIKGFVNDVNETAKGINALKDRSDKLRKDERNWLTEKKKLETELSAQKSIANDTSKSAVEREAAVVKALALQKEINAVNLQFATEAYNIQEGMIALEGETEEALDKKAELQANLIDVETNGQSQINELYRQLNTIRDDGAKAQKKAIDDKNKKTIEGMQSELAMFLENQNARSLSLEEDLKFYDEVAKRKKAILEEQLSAGLISQQEYNLEFTKVENERINQVQQREIEASQTKLDLYIAENEGRKRLYVEDLEYYRNINQQKQEILQAQLDAGLLSQEEYNLRKIELDNEYAQTVKDRANEEKEIKKADDALAFELKLMDEENEFEKKRQQLERDKAEELRVAEETGRDTSLIEQKYAKLNEDLKEQEKNAKIGMAADAAGQLADILGQETVAGKAAAIAQATINTYQGASAALKMGMPLGGIFAGLTIAAGLKTVAQIAGIKLPKAERGMSFEIGGRRHFAGGTVFRGSDGSMFEAEKGEQLFILNRGASAEYRQNLSALNMKHGGQSLYSLRRGGYYERGGQVVTTNQDYSDIISAFERSQFVVQVVDIADGLNTYGNTVDINTWAL